MRGDLPAALQAQSPIAALKDVGPKLQRERMRALAEIGLVNIEMNDAGAAVSTLELASWNSSDWSRASPPHTRRR